MLKYCFEFIFDDDPARDVQNFLLTAAAIGMLFKRGATLSAAEGEFWLLLRGVTFPKGR